MRNVLPINREQAVADFLEEHPEAQELAGVGSDVDRRRCRAI
jgi:hypothetical protein